MKVADWLLSAVATKHNLLVLANTTYYMEIYIQEKNISFNYYS